ncbi:Ribonuclease S-7 [Linum grandiflorum]
MQWPPAFCNQRGASCRTPIINNRFTIHGMWPQKNNGQSPQNCPGRVADVRGSVSIVKNRWIPITRVVGR